MKIEQLYTGCLAHGAYYIESNGEAAIIDPLREVQPYIDMADERNASIKYIFETHFHADFVSGHIDLAAKTGAPIIYGPTTMSTGFDITVGQDGQEFKLGNVTIKLLHTPGHTAESSCYLLIDENGNQKALFSGDTLFIGDVGRPDLAQKVIAELTQDKLARMLYHSLRDQIMPLNDDVIVYPGHGAGSACGKNMSDETTDTLGNQKKTNYALRIDMTEDEFVEEVLIGLMPPPAYFPHNVLMNIQGYENIDTVIAKATQALNIDQFTDAVKQKEAMIIDTRSTEDFMKASIPQSVFIGIDGNFATWAGTIIQDVKQPIVFLADEGREIEVATRLARVGFDNNMGFLKGGLNTWIEANNPTQSASSITPDELADRYRKDHFINILDVRKLSEYESQHIEGAINAPLDYYAEQLPKIDPEQEYYIHCLGGYRSVIFLSLLMRDGFTHLVNVEKGFKGIAQTGGFDLTTYSTPTTML